MPTVTSFRDIRAWQTAMQLAVDVYQLTNDLPPTEKPGLSTELQRPAAAIPTQIASGHKTGSRRGMLKGCEDALLTCNQLETLLLLTGQLYPKVPSNDLLDQLDELEQMIGLLVKKLAPPSPAKSPVPRKTL